MPAATPADSAPPRRLYSPDMLYGWEVAAPDGQVLGTVHQLVLDVMGGGIAYVIVASGGFLGMGERRYPLPWQGLVPAPEGRRLTWSGEPPPHPGSPPSIPSALLTS